jgi:2-keto-4-pentenoate hydratase/2-oxohepta-3-ene-1,7-dioic acid hydratase in catechol pathway
VKIIRFVDTQDQTHYGIPTDSNLTHAEKLSSSPISGGKPTGETISVKRLLAPVEAVNVLCIGLNYRRHALEAGMDIPERPVLFMKPTSSVTNPGEDVIHPTQVSELDYECELAVVIGKTAKNVSEADALDHVLGYTACNDLSARDWQIRLDKQWIRGKSFDGFCPLGPVLVTTDEIPDPQTLRIQTRVNGVTLQDSSTADMIFSVRQIVSYLSKDMTLLPGTVIITGTPEGVGMGRKPQLWLKPGDVCEIDLEGVGVLTNKIIAD